MSAVQASLAVITALVVAGAGAAQPTKPPFRYVWAKAYHIPPETTTEESGYFSLCEGKDSRVYVGTAAYGRNSYLVEFDPRTEKMKVVLDTHKLVGLPSEPTGYAAQSKIHTRNFVGPSGTVYLGSKQGYPTAEEKKTGKVATYRGGYVMTYDPATGKATNLGMPMALDDKRHSLPARLVRRKACDGSQDAWRPLTSLLALAFAAWNWLASLMISSRVGTVNSPTAVRSAGGSEPSAITK